MIFETSWDDDCPENLKLAALLYKYELPATFYLEAVNVADRADVHKGLLSMGFEVGCHSYTHPMDIKKLSSNEKLLEIDFAKDTIEKHLGIYITKFCYPRGRYDEECIQILKKSGYREARTTKVLQTEIVDAFQKPTTIHWFDRKEYQGRDLLEISKEYFDKAVLEDSYFHLWGHAWEIEKNGQWGELEKFFQYIKAGDKHE